MTSYFHSDILHSFPLTGFRLHFFWPQTTSSDQRPPTQTTVL